MRKILLKWLSRHMPRKWKNKKGGKSVCVRQRREVKGHVGEESEARMPAVPR